MIHIDFETRSEIDIKKCGSWRYAEDPSTKVLCMAWCIDDGPTYLWRPGQPFPISSKSFYEHDFAAYNAFFERCIWQHVMVKHHGWPEIAPERWRCIASRAAARALPRALGLAGQALRLTTLKDEGGKRTMMKLAVPRKATKNDPSKWHEDPLDYLDLYEYCKNDVDSERAIAHVVRDLSPQELKIWQLDQTINARGVSVDQEAVRAALYLIAAYTKKLLKEVDILTDGELQKVSQRDKVLDWLLDNGAGMAGYTKQDVSEMLKQKVPKHVRRLLEIRQQLGKSSTKKYERILTAVSSDGRLRDTLMYHGASTGRWTGKIVQLQNLPRGIVKDMETAVHILKMKNLDALENLYDDVMGTLSSCIRGMFVSAPGKDFVVADYSAIEARVLFWLADEQYGLQQYRQKEDLYKAMARAVYKKKDGITPVERGVGKQIVLGCGYQMGGEKFCATAKLLADLDLSKEFGIYAVELYRSTYPMVPRLWYAQEAAAVQAVKYPGKLVPCGKVKWGVEKGVLYCQLPSGRLLAYNEPRVKREMTKWETEKDQLSYLGVVKNQLVREKTYGGKLVENITQAVARDVMAEAMLRVEEHGFPIVLSVHDELVSEIPETWGPAATETFCRLMAQLPSWAAGCPIAVEGWRGKRYQK